MIFQKPAWAKARINDRWARIAGIPVIALIVILMGDHGLLKDGFSRLSLSFLRNLFYVGFYWESARLIFLYVHYRFPHLKETSRRIIVELALFFLLIFAGGLFVALVNVSFFNLPEEEGFRQEFFDVAEKSLLLLGPVMLLYECAHLFALYQTNLYEAERFKKEALLAQFELLKSQIDPHFLFNSLNTLISLIPDDPEKSMAFVQSLANVYRSVLTFNEEKLVELGLELRFLRDYIFLFQIRFGHNLIVNFEMPDNLAENYIVPFTLQILVENAVKHNIISQQRPLTIQIIIDQENILVINNLQVKTSGVESTNTGLKNIIDRYNLVSGKNVLVEKSDTQFKVTVPLIKKKQHESIDY